MTEQTKEKLSIRFKPSQFIESNGVLLRTVQNPKKAIVVATDLHINIPEASKIYWLQQGDYVIMKNGVYCIADITEVFSSGTVSKMTVHVNFYGTYNTLEQYIRTSIPLGSLYTRDIAFMANKGLHVVSKRYSNLVLDLVTKNKIYKK